MDINRQNLDALFTAVKTSYHKGRTDYKPLWPKIATRVPSTTSVENYAWLGQFPRMREWIGERHLKKMSEYTYSIKNKEFESTVTIPGVAIEDDQYGLYMPLFEEMGLAAESHPDEMLFALLAAGFETKCYDGQNFFDRDHPGIDPETGDEISISNMQDGTKAAWFVLDASRPLKPTINQERRKSNIKAKTDPDKSDEVFMTNKFSYGVDSRGNYGFGFWQQAFGSKAELNEDNFNAAVQSIMGLKSDEGRPLGLMPTLLVVGPTSRADAKKAIERENNAQGESNINYKAVEVLVVPWLP